MNNFKNSIARGNKKAMESKATDHCLDFQEIEIEELEFNFPELGIEELDFGLPELEFEELPNATSDHPSRQPQQLAKKGTERKI